MSINYTALKRRSESDYGGKNVLAVARAHHTNIPYMAEERAHIQVASLNPLFAMYGISAAFRKTSTQMQARIINRHAACIASYQLERRYDFVQTAHHSQDNLCATNARAAGEKNVFR